MPTTESANNQTPKRLTLSVLIIIALLLGIAANLFLTSTTNDATKVIPIQLSSGTLISNPRPLLDFSLQDHAGKAFTQESIKGRWHLLTFGYTHCPDICPTTLAMLAQMDDQLSKHDPKPIIDIDFITIDPQRDTAETLANYMPYFNKTFIGVTGKTEELNKLTRQLGILYARVEADGSQLDYLMDHSSSIILINPQGGFQAIFSAPHDAALMAEDLLKITTR